MSDQEDQLDYSERRRWRRDATIAISAGAVASTMLGVSVVLLGELGNFEAKALVGAAIPVTSLFASTVMTVTATILALMMTLLGFTHRLDADLEASHFHRIQKIALYDALLFAAATVIFIVQGVPVQESRAVPAWLYPSAYYALLGASSLVAGGVISIVAMLYLAVRDFIDIVGPFEK